MSAALQGLFSDVPLIGVLSLLHDVRHSGRIEVEPERDVPFWLQFGGGEVLSGGILDWEGLDAIQCSPLIPRSGSFRFERGDADEDGLLALPYDSLSTEWARVSDEWPRILRVLGSPSVTLRGTLLPTFQQPQGCSVRAAAAFAGVSLADMSARAAAGVLSGELERTGHYAWFDLVLPAQAQPHTALTRALDGRRSLGQLLKAGFTLGQLRDELLRELKQGLRFAGCGWTLRDVLWECQYA